MHCLQDESRSTAAIQHIRHALCSQTRVSAYACACMHRGHKSSCMHPHTHAHVHAPKAGLHTGTAPPTSSAKKVMPQCATLQTVLNLVEKRCTHSPCTVPLVQRVCMRAPTQPYLCSASASLPHAAHLHQQTYKTSHPAACLPRPRNALSYPDILILTTHFAEPASLPPLTGSPSTTLPPLKLINWRQFTQCIEPPL